MFHLAHHQYTNDPRHDPDLVNLGPPKRVDDFPMSRLRTVVTVYFRYLILPLSFVQYGWEYIYINSLGKGGNVYMRHSPRWRRRVPLASRRDGTGTALRRRLQRLALEADDGRARGVDRRGDAGGAGRRGGGDGTGARAMAVPVAVAAGLFAEARGLFPIDVLHAGVRGAGLPAVGDRGADVGLSDAPLVAPVDDDLHVLHVPEGHLPAHERRRRPADELAGVLRGRLHAMGGVRPRAGHARAAPPVPGRPALPAEAAARPAEVRPRGVRRAGRRVPRDVRQRGGRADDPRRPDGAAPRRPGLIPSRSG